MMSKVFSSPLRLVLACCSLLFLLTVVYGGVNLYRLFYQPMIVKPFTQSIVYINKSTSATAFVQALETQQLIHSSSLFRFIIRLQGLSTQLKAGIYQVKVGESAQQFLYRVVSGDVLVETFRIIEGTTQQQVAANLANSKYLTYRPTDWSTIMKPYSRPEGLLLADTYQYDAGTQSNVILARARANLQHYLDDSWQQKTAGLPYKNAYELLIVASIVEKETAIPAERRLIAGVIVNRLRKYMPLQMDPTVIYALGLNYKGQLTHADLQVDSPYNSYRYRGLPPTPIAMVGKDSLDAAAHPQMTDYLYFVAKGDGSHQFSVNYVQQQQAIARYLKGV